MPVRTKPSSEYKKHFRWNDSVKSASFTPTKQQKEPQAGLTSVDFADTYAITREPALQRRRKPVEADNKMTYTTKQYLAANDSDETDVGKSTRIPGSPLAKTFVKPIKTRRPTEKDEKTETNKVIAAQTQRKSALKQKPKEPPPPPTKTARGPSITRTERPLVTEGGDAPKGNGKAPVETDAAMQYRAGIRARTKGPRYNSEYQRQFAWKQPTKETPLVAAEQMVHNSNANLAPYVPDKLSSKTEYQRQFKQQQNPMPSAKEQLLQNAQQEVKARYVVKTKSKKSKKPGASPDRLRPAGVPSVTSHDDPRLIKSTQNPQRPFFPHATVRKWRSEYGSNYKPPQVFSYENGVWKGADPPHVQPRDDSSVTKVQVEAPLQRSKSVGDLPVNWYAEVLELRERAKEYQKRSRGTHFSGKHLAQLLADQARLWEESSDSRRSTASSTSTQTEKKDEQKKDGSGASGQEEGESPARRRLAWPSDSSSQDAGKLAPQPRRSSTSSLASSQSSLRSLSSLSSEIETIEENGRVPTPTLREEREAKANSRHHLARTTPAKGGALLTSPPSRKRSEQQGQRSAVEHAGQTAGSRPSRQNYMAKSAPAKAIIPGGVTKGFGYDSDDEADDDTIDDHDRTLTDGRRTPPRRPTQRSEVLRSVQTSPAAGRRTLDPHPINEELSSPEFQRHSEQFFETSPGMPKMLGKIEPPKTWAAPRRELMTEPGGKGPLERPHSGSVAGRPQTAYPATRKQASLQRQRLNSFMSPRADTAPMLAALDDFDDLGVLPLGGGRRDSDELSLSTISNASSSTLASEVLERAKKRRDDFWGKDKRD